MLDYGGYGSFLFPDIPWKTTFSALTGITFNKDLPKEIHFGTLNLYQKIGESTPSAGLSIGKSHLPLPTDIGMTGGSRVGCPARSKNLLDLTFKIP